MEQLNQSDIQSAVTYEDYFEDREFFSSIFQISILTAIPLTDALLLHLNGTSLSYLTFRSCRIEQCTHRNTP